MKRFLCFGASLTEGWVTGGEFHPYSIRLSALLNEKQKDEWQVINKGISGQTTADLRPRLPGLLKANKFEFVAIIAGTNDLGMGFSIGQSFANLTSLYNQIREHGARVVVITLPPVHNAPIWHVEKREALNHKLRECAAGQEGYVLVDLTGTFTTQQKDLWSDALHFSEKGYDIMGEMIFNQILHLLE